MKNIISVIICYVMSKVEQEMYSNEIKLNAENNNKMVDKL